MQTSFTGSTYARHCFWTARLLHLAPDIQKELLFLQKTVVGRDPIHEKLLRPISAEMDWARQRGMWEIIDAAQAAHRYVR